MRNQQQRSSFLGQRQPIGDIAPVIRKPQARGGIHRLPQPQDSDFGAHHGAIHPVKIQYGHSGIIPGQFEIAVQKTVGEIVRAMTLKRHDREGDFAHGVDPAQIGVKLDAIKQLGLAGEPHDIAQMKIAMTLADLTSGDAAQQCWPKLLKLAGRPGPEPLQFSTILHCL